MWLVNEPYGCILIKPETQRPQPVLRTWRTVWNGGAGALTRDFNDGVISVDC